MAHNWGGAQGIHGHQDWLAVLEAHQVQYLILDAGQDHRLLQAAQADPNWAVDCQEGDSVLLARVQEAQQSERAA